MTSKKTRTAPGPQNRDSSGRFVKGASGNPGGKKWLPDALKIKARSMSHDGLSKIEQMIKRDTTSDRDLISAVRLLLEYGYGRPAAEFDRERLDIEIRRLAMDERKAELEQKAASGDSTIRIVLSDEVKELAQ